MSGRVSAVQRTWTGAVRALSWTAPTSSEIATVLKAGLASGLSFAVARLITDVPNPLLAPATAIVTVHATAWTSLRTAVQRSIAVVVGVIVALAIGDAVPVNAWSVAILVTVSLGISVIALRFSDGAANQLPITVLLVLAVVSNGQKTYGIGRAVDTIIGAAIGGAVSVALPASRLQDARQTLSRLAWELADCLRTMGAGIQRPWSDPATEAWTERAHRIRNRLGRRAVDAIGTGRRAARLNYRDRRHLDDLVRYDYLAPRFERISIGVSEIARELDQIAARAPDEHHPTPKLGGLLIALADTVRAFAGQVDAPGDQRSLRDALADFDIRRGESLQGAKRRARLIVDGGANGLDADADEWLAYGAILVQADAIIADVVPLRNGPESPT